MSTIQPQQQPEQQSQPQQPGQQQQQPVLVYPNTVSKQPPNSHHSNGSFGTVFIVLAIIVVISAIACFLGRLCNRRVHNSKPKQSSRPKEGGSGAGNGNGNGKNNHHNHKIRPKEGGSEFGSSNSFRQHKEGDLEFGFDMRSKPNGFRSDSRGHGHSNNGLRSESRGHGHHGINGNGGGGGDMKGEMKHGVVDEGGLRASA